MPTTKAVPKEMLPVFDKPMLHYVVEELANSGIDHVIIITSRGKHAMEDYFDSSPELEQTLAKKGDETSLKALRRLSSMADIIYLRQREQRGLGHAVLCAKAAVGNEPFAVVLPDDLIRCPEPAVAQMLRVYEKHGGAVVAVEQIPGEAIQRYGVVRPAPVEERVYKVVGLVEKPAPADAPSDLGIVGRYILDPAIFRALEKTRPGTGGEIQLTDGMAAMMQDVPLYAYRFEGIRYDVGNPLGMLKASLAFALEREDVGAQVREYIKELASRLS